MNLVTSTTSACSPGERLHGVLNRLQEAMRRSRRTDAVTLVAVSKFQPPEAVLDFAALGVCHLGENYVQEALHKQQIVASTGLHWHFIGHIQTNKAKDVAGRFALVHTVDNLKLAEALQRRLPEACPAQQVLIQVNIGREPQKAGVMPEDVTALAEAVVALPGLSLQGLMCLPPLFDDPEGARPFFAALRQHKEALETRLGRTLPHLSMGMSGDFEAAIEEGATLVRVGTTLFGPR